MTAPDELAREILGFEPTLTAAEVAAEHGLTVDQVRRIWRALGLPEVESGARAFTEGDSEALALVTTAVGTGLVDLDVAVSVARALGQTMSRLADWEITTLMQLVDAPPAPAGEERTQQAVQLHEALGTTFEQLMLLAWRRHLAAAVSRIFAVGEADPHTVQLTVGFADIVGFTALSNTVSREHIGDVVELFESRCADVVSTHKGRVVKSIGDSVLFVNADPVASFETAEGIINVIGRDHRMPDVRVGLASGSVLTRMGDVFGPPVNLAARLTAVARRNRIIIDAETARHLPADQFETRRLPARPLRGFGDVEPLTVHRL